MNVESSHSRWVERSLLIAVLIMQLFVFWQLRMVTRTVAVDLQADQSTVETVLPESFGNLQSERADSSEMAMHPFRSAQAMAMDAMLEKMAMLHSAVQFNRGWERLQASPTLDMRHTENGYLVTCSMPNVSPENLGVLLDGRVLTVKAWCSAEGSTGGQQYERRILLPGPVGPADDAQALLTNGLLRVHVPKGAGMEKRRMTLRLF